MPAKPLTREPLTRDELRAKFEDMVQNTERFRHTTPLGTMTVNGEFSHYINADTDTLWIGFAFGYRYADKR